MDIRGTSVDLCAFFAIYKRKERLWIIIANHHYRWTTLAVITMYTPIIYNHVIKAIIYYYPLQSESLRRCREPLHSSLCRTPSLPLSFNGRDPLTNNLFWGVVPTWRAIFPAKTSWRVRRAPRLARRGLPSDPPAAPRGEGEGEEGRGSWMLIWVNFWWTDVT